MHDFVHEGHRVHFDVEAEHLDEALKLLVGAGVQSLTSQPPTLEELFLRHYGDREPESAAAS